MEAGVITVRVFEEPDIPAVVELESASGPRPCTPSIFRDELRAENRSYVVAEADVVAGFGGVMVVGDEAHITNLVVTWAWRRQGIGGRILTRLIRDALGMGARHVTLEVRGDNEPARRLYHRFGLAPVGIRPGYYDGEDALILWAHDIDKPGYARSLN